jgi:hypothetical protein
MLDATIAGYIQSLYLSPVLCQPETVGLLGAPVPDGRTHAVTITYSTAVLDAAFAPGLPRAPTIKKHGSKFNRG